MASGSARMWIAGAIGFALGLGAAWVMRRPTAETPDAASRELETVRSRPASSPTLSEVDSSAEPRRPAGEASTESSTPRQAVLPSGVKAPSSIVVYGQLLELDGTPIRDLRGAWVVFTDRLGTRRTAGGGAGEYAIGDLSPGRYVVEVNARGIRRNSEIFDLSADAADLRKDLRLSRAVALPVHVVTTTGEPLLDALRSGPAKGRALFRQLTALATKDPPGHVMDIVERGVPVGVGWFADRREYADPSLPATCIGRLFVDGDLPLHVSLALGCFVLRSERVEPGAADVRFVLSVDDVVGTLGSLQVQVLDATTSAPIPFAGVFVRGWQELRNDAQTNSKGIARIDPALPGRFELGIRASGYEQIVRTVALDPGGALDLGTIALSTERTLSARVTDAEGHPVSTLFTLGELSDSSRGREIVRPSFLQSTAEGVLKSSGLGRGIYVLQSTNWRMDRSGSESTDVSRYILIDTSGGPVADLDVRLERSVPLVVHVEGRGADGLRLRVLDEQKLPIIETRFYGEAPHPLRLPPGTYLAVLFDAEWNEIASTSVTLAREPVELAIGG